MTLTQAMKLSRRTTVIGLSTLAVGAGVISSSGAFDSVEANRSFEVSVSDDAGALLGLEATNDVITGTESGGAGGNEVIYFELTDDDGGEGAVNENAVTDFFDAMRVTNNGSQTVTITIELDSTLSGVSFLVNANESDPEVNLTTRGFVLSPGQSILVDLQIDTTAAGGYVEPPSGDPYQITIQATTEDTPRRPTRLR